MAYKRLLLQIYLSFLAITLAALVAITWYSRDLSQKFYLKETSKNLTSSAYLLRGQVLDFIKKGSYSELNQLINQFGKQIHTRITVILPDGTVIADSEENPKVMDNHSTRPEIIEAFSGKMGSSKRYSHTIEKNLMYVAIPVFDGEKIAGVVRTSIAITAIEETLSSIQSRIILAGILLVILTALVGWLIFRRISAPYEEITNGVARIAEGDLDYRIQTRKSKSLDKLATALNDMVSQLDEKIKTINRQKSEQQAVLQSMAEGVIAVDQNKHIITINRAAYNLLGLDSDDIEGKKIKEIVRYKQLRKVFSHALKSHELIEDELVIPPDDQYVQVHGTALTNEDGETIGALIVLNDVTRLRRLEAVRRDFVANVSHEIRTPLTSIKGFLETLMDGAIDDPETAKSFLDIMIKQSNRLNSIIEDLLSLASLEENEKHGTIPFSEIKILEVIKSAIQICRPTADQKNIKLIANCNEDIEVQMNGTLIEQALVNLIENAVKYSPENTEVEIKYCPVEKGGVISVKDQGMGIEKEHLPRIFERFYRVDKARSRKLGGTGLGLAIVKHIAKVHNGKVTVESEPGKGSQFSLYIPLINNTKVESPEEVHEQILEELQNES